MDVNLLQSVIMSSSTSLVSQSVLMALTVTVNKFASSNVHAVPRAQHRKDSSSSSSSSSNAAGSIPGRRGVLLSAIVGASPIATDYGTELLSKYLKKSEENKAKNDKERMDSYYKRNYKDYFDFVEGSLRGKRGQELSDSEKGILEWLKSNK